MSIIGTCFQQITFLAAKVILLRGVFLLIMKNSYLQKLLRQLDHFDCLYLKNRLMCIFIAYVFETCHRNFEIAAKVNRITRFVVF